MKKTDNYGLVLYDKEDKMIITAEENSLNANMKIIDKTLKEKANSEDIPTKTSELENDSGFIKDFTEKDPTVPSHVKNIKENDIENWNKKSEFSGNYNDLTNKPTIPTVPTKVSELENDKNYLTNVPSEFVTDTELQEKNYATESFVTNKIAEAELSGSEVDLSGLATKDELDNKVDKVTGKSLIADSEITRLASVKNYDDTELKNQINSKATINDMTTYIEEHKNELKGEQGPAGKDGTNGTNGKDGVSVTHSWNGTTLTVTSASGTTSANLKGDKGDKGDTGSKGTDGYTPVKGVDYWTEDEKNEITSELSQIEAPIIVSSIDEMVDTTKHYILDGYIYSNRTITTEGSTTTTYPNMLNLNTVSLNTRLSGGSGNTSTSNGYYTTDFIDVSKFTKKYSEMTPYNVRLNWELPNKDDNKVVFYNASKTRIGNNMIFSSSNCTVANGTTVINTKKLHASSSTAPTESEVAYVKFQLSVSTATTALTDSDIANCEMTFDANYETVTTESTTKQEWSNSGLTYTPTFKTDLIGVLGENNIIYLSDNALTSGTYTLKYGDEAYDTVGTITVN